MSNKRLRILLWNALCVIENESFNFSCNETQKEKAEWLKNEVGITEKELKEIKYI